MRALLISGYAGETRLIDQGPGWSKYERLPLTAAQVSVAEGAIMVELTWLDEGVLLHGDAHGIDTLASALASVHGLAGAQLPMPANWTAYGRPAGLRRNEAMLTVLKQLRDCGYECRVLCLPGPKSRGTRHMEEIARSAKFDVTVQDLP